VRGRVPVRRVLSAASRHQGVHDRARRTDDAHGLDVRTSVRRTGAVGAVPTAGGRHYTVAPERVGGTERVQAGRYVGRPVGEFHGGDDAREPLEAAAAAAIATVVGRHDGRGATTATVHHRVVDGGRTSARPAAAVRGRQQDHVQSGLRRQLAVHHRQADGAAVLFARVEVDGLGAEHSENHAVRGRRPRDHAQTRVRRRVRGQHGADSHVDGERF